MVERLYEDQTIQDNMKAPVKAANIDKRSKKFSFDKQRKCKGRFKTIDTQHAKQSTTHI